MKESGYQHGLIGRIKNLYPGCIVLKNDAAYLQGFPDLLVLYRDRWAALEVKQSKTAGHQPNQDYYVRQLNEMGFAAFVYPENEGEVMEGMTQWFSTHTPTWKENTRSFPRVNTLG